MQRMMGLPEKGGLKSKKDKPPGVSSAGVGKKARTAAPSPREVTPVLEVKTYRQVDAALEGVGKKGPGRPAGPHRVALLIKVPPELVCRLDRTKAKKGLETRNETIVALLDEGAEE